MLMLLFFIICFVAIYGISKYNGSPNLFIKLTLMLILGFAAGIFYTSCKGSSKKEVTSLVTTQMGVNPDCAIALSAATDAISQLDSENLEYTNGEPSKNIATVINQEISAKSRDPVNIFDTS